MRGKAASDDAVAILMALRWPDVVVEGISVVAGNVPLEMCSRNARYTVVDEVGRLPYKVADIYRRLTV